MKSAIPATEEINDTLRMKLKTIRDEYKFPIKRMILIWMPFAFMLFMTAMTLAPIFFKVGDAIPSSLIPFVCFLPMAFFFVANATFTEISGLEARIRDLEKKNA